MGPFPSNNLEEIMKLSIGKNDLKKASTLEQQLLKIDFKQLTPEQQVAIFQLLDAMNKNRLNL